MNILAENISRRRKELKITQKQLADKLNISDKTISRWETGAQVPDGLIIPEIAAALKTSVGRLYGEKEISIPPSAINSNVIANYKSALAAVIILLILSAVIVHKSYSAVSSYIFFAVLSAAAIVLLRAEIKYRAFYNSTALKNEYQDLNRLYLAFTGFCALGVFNILYKTLTPFSYNYMTENIYVHFPKYHTRAFIINCLLMAICYKKKRDKKALLCGIAGIVLFFSGFCLYILYPDPRIGQLWTIVEINARKKSQYLFFAGSILFTAVHWINFLHLRKSLLGDKNEKA